MVFGLWHAFSFGVEELMAYDDRCSGEN